MAFEGECISMQTFLILLGVVVVIAALYWWYSRGATLSAAMFDEIRDTILRLQQAAAENVFPLEKGNHLTGIHEEKMARQSSHVGPLIRFVYTIEESPTGLVHVISSQLLRPMPEKYQVQCMLVAMLTLNRQLSDSGTDPQEVEFDIEQSVTGTQYVMMSVTQEQHDRMLAEVAAH